MNAKRKKTLFKIADRVWDDMILLLREEGPDSVLVPPESTTKSKTVVTQPELDALDESISVWQKRVAILNEDYTKSVHKTKCPCCEHGKEIGGLSACSFCAIGKAGYIECRGTGYYIKGTIRKGTKEYRDAYRKILCKLMEIRLNCEVICPRRQRSQ